MHAKSVLSYVLFILSLQQSIRFRLCCVGQDSSIGRATHHGLDGPGVVSRYRAIFSAPVQNGPGAYPVTRYSSYWVSYPGGKVVEAWRLPPTPIWRRGLRKSLRLDGLFEGELKILLLFSSPTMLRAI
jgi:hypothetical protein